MSSVTRRIKRNMHELEKGFRGKWNFPRSKRIDRRIARADARLKEGASK